MEVWFSIGFVIMPHRRFAKQHEFCCGDVISISWRTWRTHSVFKIVALIWVSFWRVLKFQPFSWRVGSNPRLQSKNLEMEYKTHIKLAHELHGTWFLVQCEELRINHLTPLLVATMPYACWFLWWADYIEDFKWHPHFQSRVAFWRVILRDVYFKGPKSCLKGIQDFNLEH